MDDIPKTMSGEQIIKAQADRIERLEAPPSDDEVEVAAETGFNALISERDADLPPWASWLYEEGKENYRIEMRAALTAFVAGRMK